MGLLLCLLAKTFSLLRASTLKLGQPELLGQDDVPGGSLGAMGRGELRLPLHVVYLLGTWHHRQVTGLKCTWHPGGLRPVLARLRLQAAALAVLLLGQAGSFRVVW